MTLNKETHKWLKSCFNKTRFREQEQAKKAIQSLSRKTDKCWRYYLCDYCSGYHLTTKPLGFPKKVTEKKRKRI